MKHWIAITGPDLWQIRHEGCALPGCPVTDRVRDVWPGKHGLGKLPATWRHNDPGVYELVIEPDGSLLRSGVRVEDSSQRKIVACV